MQSELVLVVGGLLIAAILVARHLTPAARLRRRRRKSHSPLATNARRPMVKFSVKTPKKD